MIVIKRDGQEVNYNRSKIIVAIGKANEEVPEEERISNKEIEEIVSYVETRKRKRILVEDIQDIIEQKLMALGKFDLAKRYIVYRYTRELVRRANTTDDSILSLIKNSNKEVMEENSNKNATAASTQRDLSQAKFPRISRNDCFCLRRLQRPMKREFCISMMRIILYSRFSTAV